MDGNKIFFTSDLHFFHQNILEYDRRPWRTIEEMNEALVQNWNSKVPDDAIVYILGDVALGGKARAQELSVILNSLKGKIILIKGNHDTYVLKSPCVERFAQIHDRLEIIVDDPESFDGSGKQIIKMRHFPPTENDEIGQFEIALFGHRHGSDHRGELKIEHKYMLDVGVMIEGYGYSPLSYTDVKYFIRKHGVGNESIAG